MSKRLRCLIVDDHYIVRQGLETVLKAHFSGVAVGHADCATLAIDKIWQESWDIVLLDICMPGRGGFEVLKEAKLIRPKMPVVVLSLHSEEHFAILALKLGASSYIRKEEAGEELISALRAALRGDRHITPALATKLATHVARDNDGPKHETLSHRELEVLMLLGMGKTVKEVAGELNLSVKTISTYRARILEKMELKNNAQLMQYALQHGLVGSAGVAWKWDGDGAEHPSHDGAALAIKANYRSDGERPGKTDSQKSRPAPRGGRKAIRRDGG